MSDITSFLVGSSWPVFILYFLSVAKLDPNKINYRYQDYTLIAPVYLGLLNVIGRRLFGNSQLSYVYSGLLSGGIVAILATILNSYPTYSRTEWLEYYVYILSKHVIVHFVIIQSLMEMLLINI